MLQALRDAIQAEIPEPIDAVSASNLGNVVDRILSAIDDVGFVVVPKEPNEEMCAAGAKFYHDSYRPGHAKQDTSMRFIWQEMIEARPK
jgi:hypothetical protein